MTFLLTTDIRRAAARQLDLRGGRAHDAVMLSRACAARWSRLAPVMLLALLVSLAVGVVSDDVWIPALEVLELDGDAGLDQPGYEAVGARVDPLAPRPSQRLRQLVADDAVSSGRIAVTPTDRAPPRV